MSFDVASLARDFAILSNLYGGFIVDHEDGKYRWETLRRFTPLFGAKVEHIIEKHLDVGSSHFGGTCSYIFGFRSRHDSNGGRHGRICFNESAVVEISCIRRWSGQCQGNLANWRRRRR